MSGARKEGGPWRPADEAERLRFEKSWCVHCVDRFRDGEPWNGEDPDGPMCIEVWCGDLIHQLTVRDGQPHCSAFKDDPSNPIRCPFTMEMDL
jgi:hypothetical protein